MKQHALLLGVIFLIFGLGACQTSDSFHYTEHFNQKGTFDKYKKRIDRFYHMLTGHYTNIDSDLAPNDPFQKPQEIVFIPIWPERTYEYWVAVYRFSPGAYDVPVIQHIFQLKPYKPDTLQVLDYEYKNPSQYAQEWRKEKPFAGLSPDQFLIKKKCRNFVVQNKKGYQMISEGAYCDRSLSEVMKGYAVDMGIMADGIYYNNSYYKAKGELLYSYKKPLFFKRLTPAESRKLTAKYE